MKIYSSSSEILRSDQARDIERSSGNKAKQGTAQPASPVQRSDQVQISDAGRALAAEAEAAQGRLTPERISEIRERILAGAYNSLEVVDQVARKMLASGDV